MRDKLLKYVTDRANARDGELGLDTPLFSEGLLDSLVVLDLVALVEKEAGITWPVAEIDLDNLDSIGRILAFVAKKQAGT